VPQYKQRMRDVPLCAASVCKGTTAVTLPSRCRLSHGCVLFFPDGVASSGLARARSRLLLPDCAGPKTEHCTSYIPFTPSSLSRFLAVMHTAQPILQEHGSKSEMWDGIHARLVKSGIAHTYGKGSSLLNMQAVRSSFTWKTLRLAASGFLSWRRGTLMENSAAASPLYPRSSMCSRAAGGWTAALYTHCSR